ncbi:acetoacetate decarboxylase family protein [Acuticoccus mangrovi]|uniref:Acetoacetate decarboxylase family protein n=1 Tax=Acuticoccus mangrovi TaxID=2796142 RepID=A0A934IQ56_9HYPH|nr:acetoacetate decarboxylase family protein [Acuticoccus mangrovi]MBJ3775569.1 acetoacetate decarboxylase family protein [Acuticoccus mangrovi]
MKGFSAPLSPDGGAAAYGPPPWNFAGRSFTILAECDPAAIAALVPDGLAPEGAPVVRFSIHDLICDLGFGWEFAQRYPERCQFKEAVIGLAVSDGQSFGFWDPFLWCDGEAEIAVGRELYGWPQREARLDMTMPHPQKGWQPGDRVTGKVTRWHEPALVMEMTIEREGDIDVPQPAFVTFYTERVIPDPRDASVVRELFASNMENSNPADFFTGTASLTLMAPELKPLTPTRIIGGRVNTISWTKNRSRLVRRLETKG